jgi:hypothetical protein
MRLRKAGDVIQYKFIGSRARCTDNVNPTLKTELRWPSSNSEGGREGENVSFCFLLAFN